MDIITTNINTPATKSPEPESETPTRIHQQPINANTNTNTTKPFSLSNGVLKRHHPHSHHHQYHHHHHLTNPTTASTAVATVTYKECLKNHAATLGGHALDGCGEFMPSPNATDGDPSSIKCAACGCHRNFHRREPEEPPISTATHVIEYQPHHRHHPPPPPPFQASNRSPNSASPPPISSSYYPSAPHMLLALSGAGGLSVPPESTAAPANPSPNARKRFRTKFTQEQKEKMHEFAERVGWKMQKRDDELVQEFCNEVGVDRGVLKVWMHNNKNTLGKRDVTNGGGGGIGIRTIVEQDPNNNNNNNGINGNNNNDNDEDNNHGGTQDPNQYENDSGVNVGTNGSSSSS